MSQITMVDGNTYDVAYQFNENRCLINFLGLFVLADRDPSRGTWDQSGNPATPDEEIVIKQFTAPMTDTTIVTVTKD